MRNAIGLVVVLMSVLLISSGARAQSETDRLRDALRAMTGQLRGLEDQRVQLQAKLSQAEREKQVANQLAARLRAQLKDAQDTLQQAVEEFNQRLADRDQTLEKWKAAYNQAADVAREKDALRAKFESEATVYKARTKSCEVKNVNLMKTSSEILAGYRDLNLGSVLAIRDPVIGIGRVSHQNKVQDFRDSILDQDVKVPMADPGDGTAQSGAGPDRKAKDQAPNSKQGRGASEKDSGIADKKSTDQEKAP